MGVMIAGRRPAQFLRSAWSVEVKPSGHTTVTNEQMTYRASWTVWRYWYCSMPYVIDSLESHSVIYKVVYTPKLLSHMKSAKSMDDLTIRGYSIDYWSTRCQRWSSKPPTYSNRSKTTTRSGPSLEQTITLRLSQWNVCNSFYRVTLCIARCGLCCHAVYICMSVCQVAYCVETAKLTSNIVIWWLHHSSFLTVNEIQTSHPKLGR